MFSSVLSSGDLTPISVLLCTVVSLILGAVIALIYILQGTYTKNFIIALILLPALVQSVILMVSGNLGAGIAVAGSFSLVRFRSAQGSAKEICTIFFAMAIGLATGMGYLAYAAMFTVIVGAVFVLITKTKLGESKFETKELRITIPENLNYEDVFEDIFEKYTVSHILQRSRTTNLGSMFDLSYNIVLKKSVSEKEFMDQIRCRNGNLTVSCGRIVESRELL